MPWTHGGSPETNFNLEVQCLRVFMQGGEESAFQAPGTACVEGGKLNRPKQFRNDKKPGVAVLWESGRFLELRR